MNFWRWNSISTPLLSNQTKFHDNQSIMSMGTYWGTIVTNSSPPLGYKVIMEKYELLTIELYFHTTNDYSAKFHDNWSIKSIATYWGMDTLATKSPPFPPPEANVEKILTSDNRILFPHHYEVFKPNLAIIGQLSPKTFGLSKDPPPKE